MPGPRFLRTDATATLPPGAGRGPRRAPPPAASATRRRVPA